MFFFFFFQAEDGIRDLTVTGVQTCALPIFPYLIRDRVPNYRVQWTAVVNNIGPARAWRAPNQPQACLITMSALGDLAHKPGMNPLEFFRKKNELAGPRAHIYMDEFAHAHEFIGWSKRRHPRGA